MARKEHKKKGKLGGKTVRIQNIIHQVTYYRKKYGIKKTIKKIISKIYAKLFRKEELAKVQGEREKYQIWIQNNEPDETELAEQRKTKFKIKPKFSIVVPMYNTPVNFFEELVDCLKNQTYSNWELCLADGSPEKNKELEHIINSDKRIKYKFHQRIYMVRSYEHLHKHYILLL